MCDVAAPAAKTTGLYADKSGIIADVQSWVESRGVNQLTTVYVYYLTALAAERLGCDGNYIELART